MEHPDSPSRDTLVISAPAAPLWPATITIHPTDRCNHSCEWCWFKRSRMEIDMHEAIKALDQLILMGAREIIVSGGGEPLLHPDIDILLAYLKEKVNVHRRLYTNGSLMGKHLLACDSFDYIRVSIDAGGEDLYAKLHGTNRAMYLTILRDLS